MEYEQDYALSRWKPILRRRLIRIEDEKSQHLANSVMEYESRIRKRKGEIRRTAVTPRKPNFENICLVRSVSIILRELILIMLLFTLSRRSRSFSIRLQHRSTRSSSGSCALSRHFDGSITSLNSSIDFLTKSGDDISTSFGHFSGLSPKFLFTLRWAVEQVGFEFSPALVKRDRVSEGFDGSVGRCEWQPVGNQTNGADGIPILNQKINKESLQEIRRRRTRHQ